MRILLPALPLLLLLSGCATVDGEQVASESVVADEATWNPCTGYTDKEAMSPVDLIREGVAKNDMATVHEGQQKLIEQLSNTGMTFGQRFADLYLGTGIQARQRELANKIAADVVMKEMLRPGSTRTPRVVEAVQHGFPIEWLIPGEQTQALYGHLIPAEPFQFTTEGEPVSSVQLAPTPAAPGQRPAGVALCPHARLTPFQAKVWTGEREAQGTKSNQRDETSDFPQTQSDQQQYSVLQPPQQLIPTPGSRALLGPYTPNAYGPGMNADATGRPFIWQPDPGFGPADPFSRVKPDAYGLGVGMDQYGRPVRPACPPGWAGPC